MSGDLRPWPPRSEPTWPMPWSRPISTARSRRSCPTPRTPGRHPARWPRWPSWPRAARAVAIITGRDARTVVQLGGLAQVPRLRIAGLYGVEKWQDGT